MINLFDRNFDVDARRAVHGAAADDAEMNLRLAEARKSGFDAGRTVGKQDAKAEFEAEEDIRLTHEREQICAKLDELIATDEMHRRDTENDIVELFLGIADRIVPEFLLTYGSDLAIERIRQSVALVRTDPVLSVHVSPDVATALNEEPVAWMPPTNDAVTVKVVADPKLARGNAKVQWKGGKLEYDIEAATNAVHAALAEASQQFKIITRETE
tara:strand:- start:1801 stop:2442 length:642 start_codon:yes stop_codon:yes gene_type:complete